MAASKVIHVILCLFVINLCELSQGELFTAISDVEPLLETHKRIIEDLDDYITKEEDRIAILKRQIQSYKREHEKAMDDVPNYLGNPINAFTLIKSMTTDLKYLKETIDSGTEYIKHLNITEYEDTIYPTLEDLIGAAQALTRLQETYYLNVTDLAEGKLNGVTYSSKMSAGDCYELGRILYNEKDFTNALAWMMAALRKFNEENNVYTFKEIDILEYISLSQSFLAEEISEPNKPLDMHTKRKKYESLCRGEKDVAPEISKQLRCHYLTRNSFLKLAPIKMEYKYINPDIVLFHEVLSNEEIEHIKEMAKPRLRRAKVRHSQKGDKIPSDNRISKSAWLGDDESRVVERVTRRVADFTGLDLRTAEKLQVANYGIGGHYNPHYDFATKAEAQFQEHVGNRIATVLFYMSDVAQGGATVFTELGLSLFPVRGAAAVWLNLHASGEGDLATRHAACPVLQGSKWVCNKWIHQIGQEFIRPCNLEYQREEVMRPLPTPVSKTFR